MSTIAFVFKCPSGSLPPQAAHRTFPIRSASVPNKYTVQAKMVRCSHNAANPETKRLVLPVAALVFVCAPKLVLDAAKHRSPRRWLVLGLVLTPGGFQLACLPTYTTTLHKLREEHNEAFSNPLTLPDSAINTTPSTCPGTPYSIKPRAARLLAM